MTKVNVAFPGHRKTTKISDIGKVMEPAFESKTDLSGSGDINQPTIQNIEITEIDEFAFNPRRVENDHFNEIKESIKDIGLKQRITVALNPETKRYQLIQGGNTRLRAYKRLYKETGDIKYFTISCQVESWQDELNKTQMIIAHLIENEARGDLVLVDKAKTLYDLELDFRRQIDGKKSLHTLETFQHKKTKLFLEFLANHGYKVGGEMLSIFRFTATKLVGNLDTYLNQGLGSPQIVKIRGVYNNLKRLLELDNNQNHKIVDEMFATSLKKYKDKTFNFDLMLDKMAQGLIDNYHPFDQFYTVEKLKADLLKKKTANNVVSDTNDSVGPPTNEQDTKPIDENISDNNDISDASKTIESSDLGVVNHATEQETIDKDDESQIIGDSQSIDKAETTETITPPIAQPVQSEHINQLRQQCWQVSASVASEFGIEGCLSSLTAGSGYLITQLCQQPNSFDAYMVWWHLLANSGAINIRYPMTNYPALTKELVVDDLLMQLYTNTKQSNKAIEQISNDSGFLLPLPHVIASFKANLKPQIWQKITEIEAITYQIGNICINDNNNFWE